MIIWMHTAKKRITKNKKSRYTDLFFVAADQTPPRQHLKSFILKNDVSKKGTMQKRYPGENPRSQNNVFNNAILRHNQLRIDLDFSPFKNHKFQMNSLKETSSPKIYVT
jgi:hypothetical protein